MSNKTYNNPWAGLSSYQDPEGSDVQLKFCGRDNESFDVMRLIDDNIFVTLYGKSGTGKTSLLNAGVFPRLRREQYLPISIRLGMDAIDMSFQQCILTKLDKALEGKGHKETIDVVPMPDDEQSPAYLWSYFARTRFVANDDSTLFPVVVFDQFEEVFRHRRQDAEALLRQIYFMMDENHALSDRMVDGRPYQYDFNFRFVASIREDDLYRLEDSIDNCYLPDMKRCRYRLRSLSEQGARDAVLIPGEGLFRPEEEEGIVRTIMEIARNKDDDSISTNILSLICSRIFVDCQKSGAEFITPALVDTFVKGNPFEQFYNEATRGFSNREKNYIEDHLVDSTGRRNSVPEADFLLHVKYGTVLLEGTQKILQRTSVSSDGSNYRIELIHDSFCEPLVGQKEKRGQRRKLRILALGIIVVCCVFGGVWFYLDQIEKANTMSKDIALITTAERARMYLEQGDSYSARVTLLDIFKDDIENISPAYLPMAETVLREACKHNTAILRGHTAALNGVKYSSDGKRLVTCSYDGTIKLWNALNGECIKTFSGHKDKVLKVDFCAEEKNIISYSSDGTVKVWDIETEKVIKNIENCEANFILSPDKRFVVLSIKGNDGLYETKNFKLLKSIQLRDDWVNICWYPDGKWISVYTEKKEFLKLNPWTGQSLCVAKTNDDAILINHVIDSKGEKIACAFGYRDRPGYARIWDVKTGRCIHTLRGEEIWVNGVSFSRDCKRLFTTSMSGPVRVWNVANGACLHILKGHPFASCSPIFSPDEKCFATASADATSRIWDTPGISDTIGLIETSSEVLRAFYHPSGSKLLLAFDDSISFYDAVSRKWTETIYKGDSIVNTDYSPKGDYLAVNLSKKKMGLLNLTSKKMKFLKGFHGTANSFSFSSDGKQVAFTSLDSVIYVYAVNSGKQLYKIKWPQYVSCIQFPNSSEQLLINAGKKLYIWNLQDSTEIKSWDVNAHRRFHMQISQDRKYVMLGEKSAIKIWEIATGKCVSTLVGHTSVVYDCVFSPDGKYVVSTSHDTMVKLWDWKSGICLTSQSLEQYLSVRYSNDGRHVVMVCGEEVRVLDFPPLQQLIDETRERFKNRKLSEDERRKYYLE